MLNHHHHSFLVKHWLDSIFHCLFTPDIGQILFLWKQSREIIADKNVSRAFGRIYLAKNEILTVFSYKKKKKNILNISKSKKDIKF